MLSPLLLAALSPSATAGIVKGPFLQQATPDSITVAWQTDNETTGEVAYGLTPGMGLTATSPSGTLHHVELTGLQRSKVYHYQVTSGGETPAAATFATAPHDEEPFRFVIVGDTRTDTDAHQVVVDQLLGSVGAPDLYLNTGDLVEDGGDSSQWQDFFDIERELMAVAPLYPVAGNHDDVENDSLYTQYFALPDDSPMPEAYYAFTFGNSRFVVVDTNDDYVAGSEQHTWLEAELSAAQADPAIQHTFAFHHHPPFTSGAHGVFDVEDWEEPRTWLSPLYETYGVDAVFNGHDHHYERSDPALTGGVTYVVSGGGGAPGAPGDFVDGLDEILGWLGMDPETTVGEYLEVNWVIWAAIAALGYGADYEGGWWRAEAKVMKHYLLVEIQGGLVTVSAVEDDGTVWDTWTLGSYDPDEVDEDGDSFTENENDCNDADAGVHPDAVDDSCDGVDQDCSGEDFGCDTETDTGTAPTDDTGTTPTDDTGTAPTDDTGSPSTDDSGGGDPIEDGDGDGDGGGCGCATGPSGGAAWLALIALVGGLRRRD